MAIIIIEILQQYYRHEPFLDSNGTSANFLWLIITMFCLNLNKKKTGKAAVGGTKGVTIWCH